MLKSCKNGLRNWSKTNVHYAYYVPLFKTISSFSFLCFFSTSKGQFLQFSNQLNFITPANSGLCQIPRWKVIRVITRTRISARPTSSSRGWLRTSAPTSRRFCRMFPPSSGWSHKLELLKTTSSSKNKYATNFQSQLQGALILKLYVVCGMLYDYK